MNVLYSEEQIHKRVDELGKEIAKDYAGKEITIAVVLKGAMVFTSDLMRAIYAAGGPPVRLEIAKAKSYFGQVSQGDVQMDILFDCKDKRVLLVEDIVDTGYTIQALRKTMLASGALEVRLCALLSKSSRRTVDTTIDYLGFEVADAFVIGYGLDNNEKYRELPFIAVVTEEK